jgi:DNA-binding MarR family transcriptional regulator
MLGASPGDDGKQAQILLSLLDSVARDGAQSQRRLASELGIALGLVNAYLRRCVKKGLLKASQAPARRYVYYLTPRGFAEKSRLTVQYLSFSFSFFRQAKEDCVRLMNEARARGLESVVLIGRSDLAEIAAICALESGVKIVGMVDANAGASDSFFGAPVTKNISDLATLPVAAIVTDILNSRETTQAAVSIFGESRVLVPQLLRIQLHSPKKKVRNARH